MSTKKTGDTITDDDLRILHDRAWHEYATACRALGFGPRASDLQVKPEEKRIARYQCADTWNALLL